MRKVLLYILLVITVLSNSSICLAAQNQSTSNSRIRYSNQSTPFSNSDFYDKLTDTFIAINNGISKSIDSTKKLYNNLVQKFSQKAIDSSAIEDNGQVKGLFFTSSFIVAVFDLTNLSDFGLQSDGVEIPESNSSTIVDNTLYDYNTDNSIIINPNTIIGPNSTNNQFMNLDQSNFWVNQITLGKDTYGDYLENILSIDNGISVFGNAGAGAIKSVGIDSPTCEGTDKLQWTGTAFICSTDVDTDTNTTYTSGDGLDLTSTEFSLDLASAGGLQTTSTELTLKLNGNSLNLSSDGLKITDSYDDNFLTTSTDFSGDVTGKYNNIVVVDDSHSHTVATLPVTSSYLGNSIGTSEIEDLAITTDKINDLAVTTAKVNDLTITNGKLAANSVTTDKITDETITSSDILNETIASADILNDTIANEDISTSAAIGYSKLNLSGSIVNVDVAAGAAIAYSKLNLTNSIVTGDIVNGTITNLDVSDSAAIAYSKLNLSNSIINSDISSSAAISDTKLSTISMLARY